MDKNTIIGLGLIGVILAVFTFFNQPSEEELKERMAQQELVAQQQKEAAEKTESKITKKTVENPAPKAVLDENGNPVLDSRSEEHTSELQSRPHLVCRLLL